MWYVYCLSQWFFTLHVCLWLYHISITKKCDMSITVILFIMLCLCLYRISIIKKCDMSITVLLFIMLCLCLYRISIIKKSNSSIIMICHVCHNFNVINLSAKCDWIVVTSITTPWYSWNTAKVGIKHQSINTSITYMYSETLLHRTLSKPNTYLNQTHFTVPSM